MKLSVFNRQGETVGSVEVDPQEFGGKINKQLLHEVVLMHLANQRAGTHSTLRRGEVAGSTKKLFRQKGTGNARVGTRRSNKRKGGGTAKGPKPRDYEYHLPKKAVRAATRMALLSKLQDNEVVVVDELNLSEIKTKQVATLLRTLLTSTLKEQKLEGDELKQRIKTDRQTWLLGLPDYDANVYRSARNIRGVRVFPVSQFNTYEVLKPKRLLLTRAALDLLRQGAKKTAAEAPAPAQA